MRSLTGAVLLLVAGLPAQPVLQGDDGTFEQQLDLGGATSVMRLRSPTWLCLDAVEVFRPLQAGMPGSTVTIRYGLGFAGRPLGQPGTHLASMTATLVEDGTFQAVPLPVGLQVRPGEDLIVGIQDLPGLTDVPVDLHTPPGSVWVNQGSGWMPGGSVGVGGALGYRARVSTLIHGCGDVDQDGDIDVLDALQVAQFASGVWPTWVMASWDCDCDGILTALDAICAAQVSVGLLVPACGLPPALLLLQLQGDVNGDGVLTILDALAIAQHAVGARILVCDC
jgi:hypothetical protein